MPKLNLSCIHPSWSEIVNHALSMMDQNYLVTLENTDGWLPGNENIFKAFTLPLDQTQYILFGESPYPRKASAIGYAFWDGNVHQLWSMSGLSKEVNRATSLRNIMKMLLVADGFLKNDTSQEQIAKINKTGLIHTMDDLFENFLKKGFLLLNASLVLSENHVNSDAKAWQPFMISLLQQLSFIRSDIKLILFGKIANWLTSLPCVKSFKYLEAEHPYNLSFIYNESVIEFFKPLHLLKRNIR